MSIEQIIREAEETFGQEMPEPEEVETDFDSPWDMPLGSEVMFLSPDGIKYGTLMSYDGKVTNVRENYFLRDMFFDEYSMPDFSNRDRIARLDSLVLVDERQYRNPFQMSAVF